MDLSPLLLAAILLIGLVLVPLGLPGLWVMVLAIIGYGWLTDFRTIGAVTIGTLTGLALLGEGVERWVGYRYAKKYGGSRRAGWGALLGGLAGAVLGVPVPIVGSVIGSFLGSFGGAALFELAGRGGYRTALAAGWGALLGRTWATAFKVALGIAIATVGVGAAMVT